MSTSEQTYDFSQVLLNDERVVSQQEKNLLAELLRRCNEYNNLSESTVTQAVLRAASEIVAQRACVALGNRMMEHLLEQTAPGKVNKRAGRDLPTFQPKPPGPTPPFPGPPGPHQAQASSVREVTKDKPEFLAPRCVVLEEFLAPAELQDLLSDVLLREAEFQISEVLASGNGEGAVDFEYRRSRVLLEPGRHSAAIGEKLRSYLPYALPRLGQHPFPVSRVEAQITASNDGDFFRWHNDNSGGDVASRRVTFVYFFHREPRRFNGGELRLYDSRRENGGYAPVGNYYTVVPRQNQVVLFDSSLAHEVTPVECSSGRFEDGRFTVNGWLHA